MKTKCAVLRPNIKSRLSILFLLIAGVTSCSKDEGSAPNMVLTPNQAPEPFTLVAVSNGALEVDVKPQLLWNAAVDPEGDAINYELFMDGNVNPSTSIASNINATEFTLEGRLPLNESLFWKVTATDNAGLMTTSNTFGFKTRNLKIPSTPVTANASFSERTDHSSVIFNDNIWVIGGFDGAAHLNDVWKSTDGETWTQVTAEAPFHKRRGHASVVFDNKMWVIGGYTGTDFLRDIWHSTDGETWTQVTGVSPFPARGFHAAVVFKDKLWVIGSLDESAKLMNFIWQSTDGETWTPVDSVSPFPERTGHTTFVFDDKIWVIGGEDFNGLRSDVWQSSDGSIWSKVSDENALGKRIHHTAVIFDNKMWVIAGRENQLKTNDVYHSMDGVTWSKVIAETSFIEREGHTTVVFDDKIWVIGGTSNIANPSNLNDVWAMD